VGLRFGGDQGRVGVNTVYHHAFNNQNKIIVLVWGGGTLSYALIKGSKNITGTKNEQRETPPEQCPTESKNSSGRGKVFDQGKPLNKAEKKSGSRVVGYHSDVTPKNQGSGRVVGRKKISGTMGAVQRKMREDA